MQRYEHKENQNVYICYFYIKIQPKLQKVFSDFPEVCHLNSNDGSSILAFGKGSSLRIDEAKCFEKINDFISNHRNRYIFSLLSYDLKNDIESLSSNNSDVTNFPQAILWSPEFVVSIKESSIEYIQGIKNNKHQEFISCFVEKKHTSTVRESVCFEPRTSKENYLKTVNHLKKHIQRGDIYEVNYCQEYVSYNTDIKDVICTYVNLNNTTKAPFSSLFCFEEFTIFSCSPERFIKKNDLHLLTQPIKGTARRGKNDTEDRLLIDNLKNDPKERSENIMIVDLMRNDLSKLAEKGTVEVDELCEIYSFETVHQMISSVSCQLKKKYSFVDILRATFPMGSMTGAPKIKAMELIEENEDFKRGLYSGSIGCITPKGDFDFSVVIRTMIHNRKKKTLSCAVGSAITIKSDAEKEYEECQIKIKKMIDVFKH